MTATSARHVSAPVSVRSAGAWHRIALSAALTGLAIWTIINLERTRTWEAMASGWLLREVFNQPASAITGHPLIVVNADSPFSLRITPECAAALIVAPLVVLCAALLLSRRFPLGRLLLGTTLAAALVVTINQFRIALIRYAMTRWGEAGYGWSHTIVGSVLTLLGVALALMVLWMVALRGPRKES